MVNKKRESFKSVFLVLIGAGLLLSMGASVSAQYSGTTYKIEEAQVGAAGSDNELSSGTYQGRATAGDTGVGIVNGTNYQAVSGFTTSETPELEVIAVLLNLNLGDASTSTALTGTSTFSIRTYLASGYVVYLTGAPPTQESGYAFTALGSPTASAVGSEQFGINLVANTAPVTVGANPVQRPDDTFSFGVANTGYNTANQYKYVNGDAVASSPTSSGKTDYTITYLVNISTITRAGTYVFSHSINAVSTF